jgi:hypothetical protein
MFHNSNPSELSSQSDNTGSEHSSDSISEHSISNEDENDTQREESAEDQDDEQDLHHTSSDESNSVGVNEDITFASRVLRRLLDETKDQEQTRHNVYQQNTATTFRKICEMLNIPFSLSDTKLLLFSSLTASVS